ncbi:MAG: hypothetical protein QOF16_1725 [Actinomycetota bacterium]|nr:hypothetical protein [Actinomycetota bacterium]
MHPLASDPKVAPIAAAAAAAGLDIEPARFERPTRTAAEAADAVGCDVGQIVKSLVFSSGGDFVLLLVSGANRVDPSRMAAAGVADLARADADAVKAATGYSIGSTPPFGHSHPIEVFMDEDLLAYDVVWASAGRPDAVFPIAPGELARISGAVVCRMAE